MPEALYGLVHENNGIVLVTGPTGSGKSTTIAAIIEEINNKRPCHVVTIEDPIEYLYQHKTASICQRELGADTTSFAAALRDALRQAPKVIVVGEMRDMETTEIALEAAETGHLVFSTLHTIDASKAIDRILGIFPKTEEDQIRNRFAQAFRFVVAQRLIPKKGGGRILAMEILKSTARTREYIIKGEGKERSLLDAMNDGYLEGMQTFDHVLENMVRTGILDKETALRHSSNANNLSLALQGSVQDDESINWEELVAKDSLDISDIYHISSALREIRAQAEPAVLSKILHMVLDLLEHGEVAGRVAVLNVLSNIQSILSEEEGSAELDQSLLNFTMQSAQQEGEKDAILAYVAYFQNCFFSNLRSRKYQLCLEILQSAGQLIEGDPGKPETLCSRFGIIGEAGVRRNCCRSGRRRCSY